MTSKLISIVSPVYNEQEGIKWFHDSLLDVLAKQKKYVFEIIYVNDGSSDKSLVALKELSARPRATVKIIDLSRNFGKEIALSAGIHKAKGSSIITLDSDGQHPVELIAQFIEDWEAGSEVVIGVRKSNKNEGLIKRYGSRWFYKLFNSTSNAELIPGSTDFRLIDRSVADEFNKLNERNRMTRSLIDWLGFHRTYVYFDANERKYGVASYTFKKLLELAINTFVSLSALPLFLAGYLGLVFIVLSLFAGIFVFVEQFMLTDPLNLNISGSAILGLLTLFLIGIVLSSQGLIGVYISRLIGESQGRPLFVIREETEIKPGK